MSLKLVPFESLDAVSYSPSTVTVAVSVAICEINTKNLKSFITVKAHCSMTHLKQQKSFGFF